MPIGPVQALSGMLKTFSTFIALGRVDGFDQDEAESERDERAVILRRLFAPKGDTLEALELADACSMRALAL